jgi:hypothetical protein
VSAPPAGPAPLALLPAPSSALRVATGTAGGAAVLAIQLSGSAPPVAVVALLVVQAVSTVPHLRERLPAATARFGPWCVIAVGLGLAAAAGLATEAGLAVLAGAMVVGHHLLVASHRDVAVSLLTTAAACVLVVSQAPGPAAVPPLAVAWAAGVAALALRRAEVAAAPTGWTGTALVLDGAGPVDAGAGASWRDVVGRVAWPVAASVVAVLVVGLLGVQPPSAADRLRGQGGAGGFGSPQGGRSLQPYLYGQLDMDARGDLPSRPVAEVPAGSDRLWRVGVLAGYDGRSWFPDQAGPPSPTADDPLGLGDADPAADVAGGPLRTDRVELLAGQAVALLPGHAVEVRPGGARTLSSGQVWLADGASVYDVLSRAVTPARDTAGGAAGTGAVAGDPASAAWTDLPPAVTDRTRALAREVIAGARTRAEVVAAVEDHLRGGYRYELDSPVPPPGQDAVDHFLFESGSGFCEQFAAAEVVLLRSLGIPARVATGFSGGTEQDGRRVVRGTDAHAWVEVWQPGTGWSPSDPTPAADAGTGLLSRLQALLADRDVRVGLAAALVLVFVAAVLVHLRLRRRRARGAAEEVPVAAAHPLVVAAERLLVALERSGRPSPPGETVAAVARRLPEVSDALGAVERAAYAARPPERAESLAAQARLDEVSGRLLADASRPPS